MSPDELTVIAGFVAGFAGSVHCVAMCGGLVGVIRSAINSTPRKVALYWCSYHTGRITSYAIAGAIVGGIAGQVTLLFPPARAHVAGSIIAGLLMIVLGGHIAQWWNILSAVERAGGRLWQTLVPVFAKTLSPRLQRHAFIGGLLWGWMPCGLVYSALLLAATSTNALSGGLTMAAFGVGTLPMLIAMAFLSGQMERVKSFVWLRRVVGGSLCALGIAVFVGLVPLHGPLHTM